MYKHTNTLRHTHIHAPLDEALSNKKLPFANGCLMTIDDKRSIACTRVHVGGVEASTFHFPREDNFTVICKLDALARSEEYTGNARRDVFNRWTIKNCPVRKRRRKSRRLCSSPCSRWRISSGSPRSKEPAAIPSGTCCNGDTRREPSGRDWNTRISVLTSKRCWLPRHRWVSEITRSIIPTS